MDFDQIIIITAVIVLLPIVPAYILYRCLPDEKEHLQKKKKRLHKKQERLASETEVIGPLGVFTIKLKGAFAGYFITLIFITSFCLSLSKFSKYELWTVQGSVSLEDKGSNIENTRILVKPPAQDIYPDGRFFIKNILLHKDRGADNPSLIVQKEGYNVETLILSKTRLFREGFKDYKIKYLAEDKIIKIIEPIVLKQKYIAPAYNEDGAIVAIPIEE